MQQVPQQHRLEAMPPGGRENEMERVRRREKYRARERKKNTGGHETKIGP